MRRPRISAGVSPVAAASSSTDFAARGQPVRGPDGIRLRSLVENEFGVLVVDVCQDGSYRISVGRFAPPSLTEHPRDAANKPAVARAERPCAANPSGAARSEGRVTPPRWSRICAFCDAQRLV